MDENDANAAQVAELEAHIKLAGQKVRNLHPGSKGYEENLENLEDYYERSVQIRQMRADTLSEQLKENQVYYHKLIRQWQLGVLAVVFTSMVIFAMIKPAFFVAAWDILLPFLTVDRIVTNGMLVCIGVYLVSRTHRANSTSF